MEVGQSLSQYLTRRLRNLFRRRYTKHWRQFNVYLCGLGISKDPSLVKQPIHLDIHKLVPDHHRELDWGVSFYFQCPNDQRLQCSGTIKIVNHLI